MISKINVLRKILYNTQTLKFVLLNLNAAFPIMFFHGFWPNIKKHLVFSAFYPCLNMKYRNFLFGILTRVEIIINNHSLLKTVYNCIKYLCNSLIIRVFIYSLFFIFFILTRVENQNKKITKRFNISCFNACQT